MRNRLLNFAMLALAAALLAAGPVSAQDQPVVKSTRIVESLSSKDIVLDGANPQQQPGRAGRRAGRIDLQVQFSFNSAELLPLGRTQLDELGFALRNEMFSQDSFRILGHTDRVGDEQYNLRLSLERATAVRNYLMVNHGIAPTRLLTAGMGYSELADPVNPASAINRRVEIARVPMGAAQQPSPGTNAAVSAVPVMAVPAEPASPVQAWPSTGGRLVPTPR
jgi:outer membrane protein OmpA-like peptidoglycan-associated protein